MAPRLELQALLETLLGTSNVYFQPPANVQMQYPSIVYNWDRTDTLFADNSSYRHIKRYQLTVIDRDPDTSIPNRLAQLPLCQHQRSFVANNLNHYVYNLFF